MTDTVSRCLKAAVVATALSSVSLFWAAPAFAQKAPSQAAAQALFEEGRKLMNVGKYADACPKLAESQKLDPGAGTLLNLAACYEKNGQTASAWATYKEAVSESEKSSRPEWAAKARQRAAALEPSLAKMVIVVPESSRSAGLTVKRDGFEVGGGEWGLAIPVDPGQHRIEASAPGRKPWSATVQVGKTRDAIPVTVPALEPSAETITPAVVPATKPLAPTPIAPTVTPDASTGSSQRTIGLVVGGVGVLGLGVGAVFGVQAMMGRSDLNENSCSPGFATCDQKGIDAVDKLKTQATVSTIGFIAGGALVAGGAVLFLTAPKHRESAARIGVRPASAGLGLAVGGAFQ